MKTRLMPSQELFGNMRQLLQEGYEADFTVTGNSMWPILRHGADRVVLKQQTPEKGDIALFCPVEGKYLLHRINRMKNGRFRAAGDANCFHDGSFPVENIVGVVVKICRGGKWYDSKSFVLKMWSFWWRLLFPLRPILLWCLQRLAACAGGKACDR